MNKSGEVVDEIDGSKGWPAGDAKERRSMEKVGVGWQTAHTAGAALDRKGNKVNGIPLAANSPPAAVDLEVDYPDTELLVDFDIEKKDTGRFVLNSKVIGAGANQLLRVRLVSDLLLWADGQGRWVYYKDPWNLNPAYSRGKVYELRAGGDVSKISAILEVRDSLTLKISPSEAKNFEFAPSYGGAGRVKEASSSPPLVSASADVPREKGPSATRGG